MKTETNASEARRQFLAKCGKFAIVTPPIMALMLSASQRNYAVAASGAGGFVNENNNGNPGQQNGKKNSHGGGLLGLLSRLL